MDLFEMINILILFHLNHKSKFDLLWYFFVNTFSNQFYLSNLATHFFLIIEAFRVLSLIEKIEGMVFYNK